MADKQLQADTAFVVHLRSYGFFHSGRERLRVQVLKRTWEHIPGSALYGALAAALIRLDGLDEEAEPFESGPGDYHALLRAVKERRLRFTPLLPVADTVAKAEEWTGQRYCEQAIRLHAALYGDVEEKAGRHEMMLFHTTPHAPLSRTAEQIHGDQLFALRTHRPLLDYYGFIFADAKLESMLRRALRLLPFMPLGGKGKFSLVEGRLLEPQPLDEFLEMFRGWAPGAGGWARLLTPMVLGDGQADGPLAGVGREMVMTGLRRYRVWRTGRYYDAVQDTFGRAMGTEPGAGEDPDAPFLPGGLESEAVRAVPERSRFRLLEGDDTARWFVEGVGNPSWTYLGWGQVVIEPQEDAEL
jgi:hypothetical protein